MSSAAAAVDLNEPPIQPQNSHLSLFKQRSVDGASSLRSSQSDLDSIACSENRRVSFNSDVRVKKIPKNKPPPPPPPQQQQQQQQLPKDDIESGPFARVKKEEPPLDARGIENEANLILRQLEGLECSVSQTPLQPVPNRSATPTKQHFHLESNNSLTDSGCNSNSNSSNGGSPHHSNINEQSSSAEQDSSLSQLESDRELQKKRDSNALYGLHALNNLDIAVNGKNVNSMPSYQEIRRTQLDSSGGSAEYSPPLHHRGPKPPPPPPLITPPKPPRKAPSISPPLYRRNMATTAPGHYSQPDRSTKMVSSMMDQLSSDARFRRRLAETSGDDDMSSSNITSSYSSRNAPQHIPRRGLSPPPLQHHAPPPHISQMRQSISPSRLSPSRTCMTDTELLRSPAEVLYAVSDKHRGAPITNGSFINSNDRVSHSASQTTQSELMQHQRPSSTYSYDPKMHHSNGNNNQLHHRATRKPSSRASSREDLLSDARSNYTTGSKAGRSYHPNHHHSLDRGGGSSHFLDREADKENASEAYKARIHVTSPDRMTPERQILMTGERKPYKTTINTATDNIIQYRGASNNPHGSGNNRYQKNHHLYKRQQDTEHYKVPKNKTPVEFLRNGGIRSMHTDSNHSSVYYNGHGHPSNGGRGQFASTRLVKNAETRRGSTSRELDREGRTIRRVPGEGRGRTYSGCSTSPDREGSPDRYARPKPPVRSYSSMQHRSPSTSPTRPPRSRSSPGREILNNVVRRVTSRREVERTPSTRATATSRSPIKEIKRAQHNDGRMDSRDRHLATNGVHRERSTSRMSQHNGGGKVRNYDESEERLARFTEYRGDGVEDMETDIGSVRTERTDRTDRTDGHRRGASVAYDTSSRRRRDDSGDESRERGRSLPPGANIDSMRDFYKSSQFKSMYALPPSPNRPAPVLERAPSASTLVRRDRSREQLSNSQQRPPQRPNRVSISEGEITDDPARHERIQRHRNKFLSQQHQQQHSGPSVVKRPSTKRQAPSPPGHPGARRVVSSDREELSRPMSRADQMRRVVSTERGLQHPPQRRPLGRKTSMGDALDSSYSESEGFNGDPDQDKPLGEFGRRWAHSDIDSDYRRNMATSGSASALHQEARGRDGGSSFSTLRNTSLERRRNSRESAASPLGRSSSSAREEERRKVLEIEEERLRRERDSALRRGAGNGGPVSRSASRVSRASQLLGVGPRSKSRPQPDEVDSQYSGHSSSTTMRKEPVKPSRFDQNRLGRVKRSTSSATNTTAASGARREIINRKKMPGSVTSSLNSSESEQGSQGVNGPASTAGGSRSVFLHAACVADIPPNAGEKRGPPRALSAESRSNLAGAPNGNPNPNSGPPSGAPTPTPPSSGSNLQKSKKISRSISLLAPWKPKQVARQFEIHYDNSAIYSGAGSGKPPRPPPVTAATRRAATMQRDKKSASSSDLLRGEESDLNSSGASAIGIIGEQRGPPPVSRTATVGRKPSSAKVSRSVSMPKDTRLAGWFKKRKRN